jgi:hypothetical protein
MQQSFGVSSSTASMFPGTFATKGGIADQASLKFGGKQFLDELSSTRSRIDKMPHNALRKALHAKLYKMEGLKASWHHAFSKAGMYWPGFVDDIAMGRDGKTGDVDWASKLDKAGAAGGSKGTAASRRGPSIVVVIQNLTVNHASSAGKVMKEIEVGILKAMTNQGTPHLGH